MTRRVHTVRLVIQSSGSKESIVPIWDQYLTERDRAVYRTAGYGSTRPVTSNHSEDNRKKNRRVEFVIVKK